MTELIKASIKGNCSAVPLLIEHGANVDALDNVSEGFDIAYIRY